MATLRRTGDSAWLRAACGAFLGVALYVLSVGPVTKLAFLGYYPKDWVKTAYQPLHAFDGTPLEAFKLWYLQLWFPPSYVGD